jgi:hypothetical protein
MALASAAGTTMAFATTDVGGGRVIASAREHRVQGPLFVCLDSATLLLSRAGVGHRTLRGQATVL